MGAGKGKTKRLLSKSHGHTIVKNGEVTTMLWDTSNGNKSFTISFGPTSVSNFYLTGDLLRTSHRSIWNKENFILRASGQDFPITGSEFARDAYQMHQNDILINNKLYLKGSSYEFIYWEESEVEDHVRLIYSNRDRGPHEGQRMALMSKDQLKDFNKSIAELIDLANEKELINNQPINNDKMKKAVSEEVNF